MRCVNCGKDINDDAASCRYCGHVYDMARAQAEYQKAQAEYQQAQAEYKRKIPQYNRQMQEYQQQMAQYNSSKQTPQGRKNVDQLQPGMQNNNMNQPYGKNSGGFNSFSGNDNRQNIQNNNNMVIRIISVIRTVRSPVCRIIIITERICLHRKKIRPLR